MISVTVLSGLGHAVVVAAGLVVYMMGTRIGQRQIQLRLDVWAQRQSSDRHLSPHMLRHSYASHVLQSSQNIRAVQELLGHKQLSTTQIYTSLDFTHLSEVYDAAHPRAKKHKPK